MDTYLDGLISKAKASSFEVVVTCQVSIWTGECDALGLVTESDTYDGLVARTCLIAPELAELNGVAADTDNLNLSFPSAKSQRVGLLMVATLYPQLSKLLRVNGCVIIRQGKGSHEIWQSPIN